MQGTLGNLDQAFLIPDLTGRAGNLRAAVKVASYGLDVRADDHTAIRLYC